MPEAPRLAEPPALRTALAFVRCVESGEDPVHLLTDDAVEEELPNRVFERGATRTVAEMRAGVQRGRALFKSQRYDVKTAIAQGDTAALELDWSGVLALPVRSLAAGETMRARCAFFFEVRGERVARLRHYDAFEPF